MNLLIRDAVISDHSAIRDLVSEVHDLHFKNRPDVYLKVEDTFPEEQFIDLLNDSSTKLFVVEDTDSAELIAYCILQITYPKNIRIIVPSKFAYIDDFCVKSSYQKKGIGKLLFQYIVDYAKAEGASSVQLTVWEFNQNAVKFYESMGMSVMNKRMELML